jgi:hypothetical protein
MRSLVQAAENQQATGHHPGQGGSDAIGTVDESNGTPTLREMEGIILGVAGTSQNASARGQKDRKSKSAMNQF